MVKNEIQAISLIRDVGGGLHISMYPGTMGYSHVETHMRPDLYTSYADMIRDVLGPGLLDGAAQMEDISTLVSECVECAGPVEIARYYVATARTMLMIRPAKMTSGVRRFLGLGPAKKGDDNDHHRDH